MTAGSPRAVSPLDEAVASITRFDVVSVQPNVTLRAVSARMCEAGVSALIVDGDEGEFGIVTEADVVAAVADDADVDVVWSGDVMSHAVQRVPANALIADVAELMFLARIRHVIVVGENDRLGIVSIRDLLDPLLSVEDRGSA